MQFKEYDISKCPEPWVINKRQLLKEWKVILKAKELILNYNSLPSNDIGKGQQVILIPGWKATGSSMFPLKKYLTKIGYNVNYWGEGKNKGDVEELRDKMVKKINEGNYQNKIILIGWSLGGVIAREIGREIPDKIGSIITYGTPIIGGARYTIGAIGLGEKEIKRVENLTKESDKNNPINLPTCVMFTKNDYFVSWPACIDKINPNAKHYEVSSAHVGLGVDIEVFQIIRNYLLANQSVE